MADTVSAWSVVGPFVGAIAGGLLNSFGGESYRRHKDGQALAGALSGELSSYLLGMRELRTSIELLLALGSDDEKLVYPKVSLPGDPVFESCVGRLGLLGHLLAEDVAFTYQQITAFRATYTTVINQNKELAWPIQASMLQECIRMVDRAVERGVPLLSALRAHATAGWLSRANVQQG